MFRTHEDYDELYKDDDMLEQGPDTRHVSAVPNSDLDNLNQRGLAKYKKGYWIVEAQVRVDDEWYISRRKTLHVPPQGSKEYSGNPPRPVKKNLGMFTNLSKTTRYLLAPLYAIYFFIYCIQGKDVNVQVLDSDQ